jgi:hypothetical protein
LIHPAVLTFPPSTPGRLTSLVKLPPRISDVKRAVPTSERSEVLSPFPERLLAKVVTETALMSSALQCLVRFLPAISSFLATLVLHAESPPRCPESACICKRAHVSARERMYLQESACICKRAHRLSGGGERTACGRGENWLVHRDKPHRLIRLSRPVL